MWDMIITCLLILAAVFYLGLRIYRSISAREAEGCAGCNVSGNEKKPCGEVLIV